MDTEASKLIEQARELTDLFDRLELPKEEQPPLEKLPEPPKLRFLFGNMWPQKESEMRKDLLGFIEQFYNEEGKLPQKKDFEANFNKDHLPPDEDEWQDFLLSIQSPLQARGIPAYELPEHLLHPHFVLAVSLICDVMDKRSDQAKLKEAGITTKQFKSFLRQEKYSTYYDKCVQEIFGKATRTKAKLNVAKLVDQGDLSAIKYFEERENIYRPQRETDLNQVLLMFLTVTMEILGKHVNPDVLQKVAIEFQERDVLALPVGTIAS